MSVESISLENEIWKPVFDFEESYLVSSFGRVYSILKGKIAHIWIQKTNGYCYVSLRKEKRSYQCRVHKLAMVAFKGPSNLVIDHVNGVKIDNRLENLEYVSQRQNVCRHLRKEHGQVKGYRFRKNRYESEIRVRGKRIYIGKFKTKEEAILAYSNAALKYHGEI